MNYNLHQLTPTCQCEDGYYLNDLTFMCDQCLFPCLTCETNDSTCLSCKSTYTLIENSCSCLINEFEDDTIPKVCSQCLSPCYTCEDSSTNCLSCISGLNRHINNQTCICDDGYFENETCKPCILPCIFCTSDQICLSCNDQLTQILPYCLCKDGYFMDESHQCQLCNHPCIKCATEQLILLIKINIINQYYLKEFMNIFNIIINLIILILIPVQNVLLHLILIVQLKLVIVQMDIMKTYSY